MSRFGAYVRILRLSGPLAIGMVNVAVMQFVDRAFLARESMAALEAVLPAAMLANVLICFFQSVVGYSGQLVAQYAGAGDLGQARLAGRVGALVAVLAGAASLLAIPLGKLAIDFSTGSAELAANEFAYFSILTAGSVFLYLQLGLAAYYTGLGRTRVALIANLVGNLANLVLDPLFIFGWCGFPAWGIKGAAVATVLAGAVQWLLLFCWRWRDARQGELPPVAKGGRELLGRLLRFGMPAGVYSVLNLLSFTIFVLVTGRVGELELAVSNACFSVNYLLIAPMEGFALGAATLVGQAQGRRDSEAAWRDGNRTIVLALVVVTVLSLLAWALARPILGLFAPGDPVRAEAFVALGLRLFPLMVAWQLFDAADVVISGALKGAGDTRFVMNLMLLMAFGVWLPLVFAVSRFHNTMVALWGTIVIYVVLMAVGAILRWRRGTWRRIRVI